MRTRLLIGAIAVVGLAMAFGSQFAAIEADVVTSVPVGLAPVYDPLRDTGVGLGLHHIEHLASGGSFLVIGLIAWGRRPRNRIGPLMVATSFTWFLNNYGHLGVPVLFSFVAAFEAAFVPLLMHSILAYPAGRLESRGERVLIAVWYALLFARVVRGLLFYQPVTPSGATVGVAPFPNMAVAQVIGVATLVGFFLLLIGAFVMLIRRFVRASHVRRRTLMELWIAGTVMALGLAINAVQFTATAQTSEVSRYAFRITEWAIAAVPIILLVGLLRLHLTRAAVGGLVVDLGSEPQHETLRDALARALGDPTVEIAYWLPEREGFVDERGRGVQNPEQSRRGVTMIERSGRRLAALMHDAALVEQPELVQAAAAATGLALENARLQAEIRAQLDEVRASRARIVEAADAARIRIERNLHDGAQQRLLAVSFALRAAQRNAQAEDGTLGEALEELDQALEELRELARGVYPAILREEGLVPALESLAERSPVATSLDVDVSGRLPEQIEATAYFLVSEATTNIARYAEADRAWVLARMTNGRLVVEVRDDGAGGADPARGSGLRGIEDRVAALGGRLQLDSPPGHGTRVVAEIPCA